MGEKSKFSCEEKQPLSGRALAFIGRALKEQYNAPQPFSERLAELMRKIEQSANEEKSEGAHHRGSVVHDTRRLTNET